MLRPIPALACLLSIATLMACTRKVAIHGEAPFLNAGMYKSRVAGDAGEKSYQLELKSSGRFILRAFAKGCLLSEEAGVWRGSREYLDLDAKEKHQREDCSVPFSTVVRDGMLTVPIRVTSSRSFQMIHEEINLGTRWTDWSMAANPTLAESIPEDPKPVVTSSAPSKTLPTP